MEKAKKSVYGDFTRVVFQGQKKSGDYADYVNASHVLCCFFPIDIETYLAQQNEAEKHRYFVDLLLDVLTKFEERYPQWTSSLQSSLTAFKAGGYKDEWLFTHGTIWKPGYKFEIRCRLDMDYYTADFVLFKQNTEVYKEQILQTLPDEIFFDKKMQKIRKQGNKLIILDFLNNPIKSVTLNESALLRYQRNERAKNEEKQ
ncbi:MAG: hypothetical protein LBR25_09530 [Erysipelotrichaceae bacterium]|jgi:hypothetical protein|nr:hypothetical protein [Erysipelotrichaceae bacterium]